MTKDIHRLLVCLGLPLETFGHFLGLSDDRNSAAESDEDRIRDYCSGLTDDSSSLMVISWTDK